MKMHDPKLQQLKITDQITFATLWRSFLGDHL